MQEEQLYCGGRYRVTTVSSEMKMSHWVEAPLVERVPGAATVLDLTDTLWDLCAVREERDVLVLVMRKYPGAAPNVEVRILPAHDRFAFGGKVLAQDELMSALQAYPSQ
jgi:hypothetical protein